jgi:hypothetical protein
VADEEIGKLVPLLQVAQQVDDLGLHAHVERRGRLVEHDQARLQDEGAGDRDALALAAGEFVRVAVARSPDRGRPRAAPSIAPPRARCFVPMPVDFQPSPTISPTTCAG